MAVEKVEALVVGAGQAGVAMSEHLSRAGVPHLVVERDRIAERWRTGRWNSLVANGPAWRDPFPGLAFDGDPEAFVGKEAVADYFADYAEKFAAPIRCGVEVGEARGIRTGPGSGRDLGGDRSRRVRSRRGDRARSSAGSFPGMVPEDGGVFQKSTPPPIVIRASCRRGGARRRGRGLGAQIAEELEEAGRRVYFGRAVHVLGSEYVYCSTER